MSIENFSITEKDLQEFHKWKHSITDKSKPQLRFKFKTDDEYSYFMSDADPDNKHYNYKGIELTEEDLWEYNTYIKSKGGSEFNPRLLKKFNSHQEYEDFMYEASNNILKGN